MIFSQSMRHVNIQKHMYCFQTFRNCLHNIFRTRSKMFQAVFWIYTDIIIHIHPYTIHTRWHDREYARNCPFQQIVKLAPSRFRSCTIRNRIVLNISLPSHQHPASQTSVVQLLIDMQIVQSTVHKPSFKIHGGTRDTDSFSHAGWSFTVLRL